MQRLSLVAIAWWFVAFSACDPGEEAFLTVLGKGIVGGTADTSPEHQGIMVFLFNVPGGQALCTGTLISRRVILTAGHCVYDNRTNPGGFTVAFGDSITSGNYVTRRVAEVWLHPSYSVGSSYDPPVNDIAMLRLSSDAPANAPAIPYLTSSNGLTTADVGTTLEFVGYGITSASAQDSAGTRRHVFNDLRWLCTAQSGCTFSGYVTASRNTLCDDQNPGGPCSGDSGGPDLITRNGRQYIAGVNSYCDQNCQYYCCSTKVDAFAAEVGDWAGGGPGDPCATNADCTSGFCADNVCCDSACDRVCYSCNQPGFAGTCRMDANGAPCPDGDRCNGDETCLQGNCVAGALPNCDDANVCTQDSCDPAAGCVHAALPGGTPCPDNGNLCDGPESCQGGACVSGPALVCDDHEPCTQDACEPSAGCGHSPLADGTACGGGLCAPGTCQGGRCQAEQDACDDGDACTSDGCDPASGCRHDPLPDGFECGDCKMCLSRQCVEVPECTADGCGCGGAPASAGAVWWLGILLACRRRRW
ncbi:MAG: trypsin-like serine protease [Myxococcales bacterium]|nr:trypsin-like serine protease [Myxococcales bacterium]